MVQQIVYTDDKENIKIQRLSKKWVMSKADTIKKIIRDFDEAEE